MDLPFDYRARPPGPRLAPFVESVWFARGTVPYASEHVAPTGASVAIVVLGAPLVQTPWGGVPTTSQTGLFIGPHDRPVRNAPSGETYAVGIVTTPVGSPACFGVQPRRLRGRVVELASVWPAAEALRSELLALEAAGPEAQLDHVLDTLTAHLVPPLAGLHRCARAVAAVTADPTRSIAEIADELGISHGHLDREFARHVGLTPRMLSRILRMQRLLATVDTRNGTPWADAAAALGWYDQAHLIRDFRRHTGVTPSRYIAAQRAVFGDLEPGQGAGFVPELPDPGR